MYVLIDTHTHTHNAHTHTHTHTYIYICIYIYIIYYYIIYLNLYVIYIYIYSCISYIFICLYVLYETVRILLILDGTSIDCFRQPFFATFFKLGKIFQKEPFFSTVNDIPPPPPPEKLRKLGFPKVSKMGKSDKNVWKRFVAAFSLNTTTNGRLFLPSRLRLW